MNLNDAQTWALHRTRRHFLRTGAFGLGALGLQSLRAQEGRTSIATPSNPLSARPPMLVPRAKSVIYIHLSGAPSQHDLFEYKPALQSRHLQPCPSELLKGQRFAFIKQDARLIASPYAFRQHGKCGAWMSELLPHLSRHVDDLTILKSMSTTEVNHAPAELFLLTGENRPGQASMGAWVTYGLGTENQNLPGFIVLVSGGSDPTAGKNAWGSGHLPSVYQGVQCRAGSEPVFFLNNPPGLSRGLRRQSLDALAELNASEWARSGDPETLARIAQYELAYRMQIAVPEVMDIRREPASVLESYGARPGEHSFANNCLLARRMVERGVRFVQLFDWGWDVHGTGESNDLVTQLPKKCREVDRPTSALLQDLKSRGLLEETLVIWGGEFGRTPMNESSSGSKFLGRDHHMHAFTMLMAGAGLRPGFTFGATDDFGFFVVENKVDVHDLQATMLHLLGLDAHRFTYRFQGLQHRLIGPSDRPRVIHEILS